MEKSEKSVAMTGPQQMRGVVIITLPGSDCEGGKTMCAAMWQQGNEQQQQQVQEQEQQQAQQEQPPPPVAPAAPPPPQGRRWGRHHPRTRAQKVRRNVLFCLFSMLALYLAYKLPTLYYSEIELEEENEEKNVHVYTLHPKYTTVPIKMSVVRRNLLERDMKRLGKTAMAEKAATAENAAGNNRTTFYPVRGNIYPDGYVP